MTQRRLFEVVECEAVECEAEARPESAMALTSVVGTPRLLKIPKAICKILNRDLQAAGISKRDDHSVSTHITESLAPAC